MSDNIVQVPQFLREAQPEAVAASIPASRHLIATALYLERVRANANTLLLGLMNCPASSNDITAGLTTIITEACEADKAYAAYAEVISCKGRA
ncbi:conserved hypothetical protein [Hyphomicrobiales bacterium]|nr:conserved hypothetical protein [Hyphomicrobiales bacterium]CAH1697267.1 hypothetical protein BOSEA1005_10304 [Hyphomicrobiales bacterium]CAI0342834.1 conserved hypothetical protein [Hyphomicrobiales bacterium]